MGFFDWLLNLFFGSKKQVLEEIDFFAFNEWFSKRTEKDSKKVLDSVVSRFAEIKHLLKEINFSLNELSEQKVEEDEQGNKRLRKIVDTSSKTFILHMNQLLEKLQPPALAEFDSVQQYCLSSWPLMQREIESFGKNIAYTSIVLKEEVTSIGHNIKELDSVLKELFDSFNSESFKAIALARTKRELLEKTLSEQSELQKVLKEQKQELEKQKKSLDSLTARLSEIEQSEEAKALSLLEQDKKSTVEKKEKLRSSFVDLLAPIDKPLRRFESLAASGTVVLNKSEKEFLQLFLRDPLLALKQDPRTDVLKKLLRQLKQAIDEEKISLKDEKEREKRLTALSELLGFDFFGKFFWEANKIEVELQKTEKELLQNSFFSKKQSLSTELASIKNSLEEKTKEFSSLQKKLAEAEQKASSFLLELEQAASKAAGFEVKIKLSEK